MIDFQKEHLRTLSEAARLLPGRPHVSTLHRWARRGVKGVRLDTVRIGGRRYTSIEAVQRFAAGLTAGPPPPAPSAGVADRRRRDAMVERELQSLGL